MRPGAAPCICLTCAVLILSALATASQAEGGSRDRRLLHAPAPSPGGTVGGTDQACCAELTAISFSSNLPVVIVNTGGVTPSRSKINADLCTCSTGLKHGGDYSGDVTFKVKGGTDTQVYNNIYKFGVKLPSKSGFLGMPKGASWTLYGQQNDTFGLHQWLGLKLARDQDEYAPRTQHFEFFLVDDGTSLNYARHYHGLYLAVEKISQGKHRVNIVSPKKNPSDPSGGFILEFTHSENPKGLATVNGTKSGKQWNINYPKSPTLAEVTFLQGYLNDFETALYGPGFTDPSHGWRAYANQTAFIDWFLSTELGKNAKHSYHSSAYMYKNAGNTLAMGPLDNDIEGFGQCCGYPVAGYLNNGISGPGLSGGSAISPNGWIFDICEDDRCPVLDGYDPNYGISVWFIRLWQDQSYVTEAAQRYASLRSDPWASGTVAAAISKQQTELQAAGLRSLQRWSALIYQPQYFPTLHDQYDYIFMGLSNWTLARLGWMDGAFRQAATSQAEAEAPFAVSYAPGSGAAVSAASVTSPSPSTSPPVITSTFPTSTAG